jgi:hypothetical protein
MVERMLILHKSLLFVKTPHCESFGKEFVQRQVESIDEAVGKLVYELYGLSKKKLR